MVNMAKMTNLAKIQRRSPKGPFVLSGDFGEKGDYGENTKLDSNSLKG